MANLTITNIDNGSPMIVVDDDRDDTLAFAGADTFVEGTILARRKVATAITPAADGGNTGNGTVTVASVVHGPVPLVGTYVLECIEAVTNGGVFQLKDPNGAIVAGYLPMTVGAGAATIFEAAGLIFTVTDGGTDFAVGDSFNLPVVADGKLVPFATDGAGGAQSPLCILLHESVRTGSGDNYVRVATTGKANLGRLVIDADGDASNVTDAIRDQLRSAGIETDVVNELGVLDNQ